MEKRRTVMHEYSPSKNNKFIYNFSKMFIDTFLRYNKFLIIPSLMSSSFSLLLSISFSSYRSVIYIHFSKFDLHVHPIK